VARILAATGPDGAEISGSQLRTDLETLWALALIDVPRGASTGVLEDARRDLIRSPELLESLASAA